jgi:restriction system protein
MAVPKFDALIQPLLALAADGKEHRLSDVVPALADQLGLSEADRAETMASGKSRFRNRCYWAKLYLSQAKAIDTVSPGVFRINDRGRELLARNLPAIAPRMLMEFPEFQAFMAKTKDKRDEGAVTATAPNETPEDAIRAAHEVLKSAVVREILDNVQAAHPTVLSEIMIELLKAMGYGDKDSPESGIVLDGADDGGVDGVVNKDPLGLGRVYFQAKRYKDGSPVGPAAIREFSGAIDQHRANEGVFVTTSEFTERAREAAQLSTKNIVLINGQRLAVIMFDLGVGVKTSETYPIKRLDSDFFSEE